MTLLLDYSIALVAYVMISPQRTVSNYCSPSQIWRLLLTAHVPTAHCLLVDVLYHLGTKLQWQNANTQNRNTKNALPQPQNPNPKTQKSFHTVAVCLWHSDRIPYCIGMEIYRFLHIYSHKWNISLFFSSTTGVNIDNRRRGTHGHREPGL